MHRCNVADPVALHAANRPDAPAIIDGRHTLTWRMLNARVRQTAAHLLDRGALPGQRVGICLKDDADHLVALLALARMGATTLALDWRAKAEERRKLAAEFDLHLMLIAENATPLADRPCAVVDAAWRHAVDGANPAREFATDPDLVFQILLTSGTTGVPKGVTLTHAQLLTRVSNLGFSMGFTRGHRYFSAVPLAFAGGQAMCLLNLVLGNTIILHPTVFSPEEFVAAVAAHRATATVVVPTVLRWLLSQASGDRPLLADLEVVIGTGAPMSADEKRAFRRHISANFYDMYGASGSGVVSVLLPGEIEDKPDSVGRPAFLKEVQVVDEAERPLPAGGIGRLRVRGPGLGGGFYGGMAPAGGEIFKDGWNYPGELARLDADGYIYLTGRAANMIIRGGVNVYPEEIEHALTSHPAVIEAGVAGVASQDYGEEPVAFVVLRDNVPADDLLAHCRRTLTAHKVPRQILPVASLPKNAAGKVIRAELAARLKPS